MVADTAASTSAPIETPSHHHPSSVGFDDYRRDLEQANQELQREVAERRRVETALRAYAQRLDHLHTTQIAILSAQSLTDTLDITIRHIKNSLPCLSTTIVMYDFDQGELEVLRSDRSEFVSGRRLPILMTEAIAQLRRGEHIYMRDILDPQDAHPGMQSAVDIGGRSVLMMPMRFRDELIGTMTVTTGDVHEFTEEELIIAREIAASLAIAIQHRRWLEAEQDAREREATLRQVAQSLTADLELEVVLREILTQLQNILPTISSAIFLRDETGTRVAASRGLRVDANQLAEFVKAPQSTLQDLFVTGQARIIDDTRQDPDWVTFPGHDYIRCWMGIPLTVKGRTIGALTLDQDTPGYFDEQDLDRATILASQAAIGIENARLFLDEQQYAARLEQQVSERTRELEALYEISAAASENLEESLLLDFSLSRAMNAVGYQAGAIHLLDSESGHLVLSAALGLDPAKVAALAPETPIGRMLADQLNHPERPWSTLSAALVDQALCSGFRTCTVAPLRSHGRVLGTLILMSHGDQSLPLETQTLLSAIADQIGLSVESAELRRQARQTAVMAERERIARDLHDVVTQSLYSLMLFAEATRETAIAGNLDEVQSNVRSIMHTARQTLGEMRMLLYDLRSDMLARKGLREALTERLATVEQRAGLVTELRIDAPEALPPALEDVLYRVALESLNNTLRHAAAQTVSVRLMVEDETVILHVEDDGIGFVLDADQNGPGMGLSNMRRRVQDVGGTIAIRSEPGAGTHMEFRLPKTRAVAGRYGGGPQ